MSSAYEIPRELIADIVQRTDLITVVSQTVALKRVGNYMMGICPFHPDKKSASFAIRTGGHHFHCYGCHAAGDVITFVKLLTNRPFREIVQELADRCGVLLPEKELTDAEKQQIEQRKKDLAYVQEAQTFFQAQLKTPGGALAREAVLKRGYPAAIIDSEGLGFSGDGWEDLVAHFRAKKLDLDRAAHLGIVGARSTDKGGGYFDRFRQRLMFPICEAKGDPVAFGGRILVDEDTAKYLNSPESPLYKKSFNLYRIDKAKDTMRKHSFAVLTEGYFDALAFVAAGIPNVVASCGTAFTPEQAKLIKRYCPRVVTAFDGDRAGLKATVAAFPILAGAGLRQDVLLLPTGEDPDTVRQKQGEAALQKLLKEAVPVIEFLLKKLVDHGKKSVSAKTTAIRRMAQYLELLQEPVERELYRQKAAQAFQIDVAFMAATEKSPKVNAKTAPPMQAQRPVVRISSSRQAPGEDAHEEMIVGLMLHAPEVIPLVPRQEVLDFFQNSSLKALAIQLMEDYEQFTTVLLDDLLQRFADLSVSSLKVRASRYLAPEGAEEEIGKEVLESVVSDCRSRLRQEHFAKTKSRLQQDLQNAERAGNREAAQALIKELHGMIEKQREMI